MLEIDNPPRFRSYLLRCWEERSADSSSHTPRRCSLEDPQTALRHDFATLEALAAFLRAQEGVSPSVAESIPEDEEA